MAFKKVRRTCANKSVPLSTCSSPIQHAEEVETPSGITEILSPAQDHPLSGGEHTEEGHSGDESTEYLDSNDEDKFDEGCLPIYEVSSEDQSENEVEGHIKVPG